MLAGALLSLTPSVPFIWKMLPPILCPRLPCPPGQAWGVQEPVGLRPEPRALRVGTRWTGGQLPFHRRKEAQSRAAAPSRGREVTAPSLLGAHRACPRGLWAVSRGPQEANRPTLRPWALSPTQALGRGWRWGAGGRVERFAGLAAGEREAPQVESAAFSPRVWLLRPPGGALGAPEATSGAWGPGRGLRHGPPGGRRGAGAERSLPAAGRPSRPRGLLAAAGPPGGPCHTADRQRPVGLAGTV